MNLIKSLLPEIILLIGALIAFIGLLAFTNLAVSMIFGGAFLMVTAAYLSSVMNIEVE